MFLFIKLSIVFSTTESSWGNTPVLARKEPTLTLMASHAFFALNLSLMHILAAAGGKGIPKEACTAVNHWSGCIFSCLHFETIDFVPLVGKASSSLNNAHHQYRGGSHFFPQTCVDSEHNFKLCTGGKQCKYQERASNFSYVWNKWN